MTLYPTTLAVSLVCILVVGESAWAVDTLQRVDLTYNAIEGSFHLDSGDAPLHSLHITTSFDFFVGPQPIEYLDLFHNYRRRRIGTTLIANPFNHLSFPPGVVAKGYTDAELAAGLEVDAYYGVVAADVWCLNGAFCQWETLAGDFNEDYQTNQADIDALTHAVRLNPETLGDDLPGYDLDFDGSLTSTDRTIWVRDIRRTHFGDADLDGRFNGSDLIRVFQTGEYHDERVGNSNWGSGDWNGDGEFTHSDFIIAFVDGGYGQDSRASVADIPEPSLLRWMSPVFMATCLRSRRDPLARERLSRYA